MNYCEGQDMLGFNLSKYLFYRDELFDFMESTIASNKDLTMDNYLLKNETLAFL